MITIQIRSALTQTASAAKNAPLDMRQALQAVTDKKAGEQRDSTKVTLSKPGKLQVRMSQMWQGMNSVSEARKSAARAHAAQLKQQIEALKKIAVMLGPMASKTLLRQIKHLAQQVRQIAAELAQSSSNVGDSGATLADVAMGGGDLSVDANVDFGLGEETEDGALESAAEENVGTTEAEAETETSEAQDAEAEGDATVAQAQQAATAAEREIKAQEEREDEKKTMGIGGNAGISASAREEARQKQQQDALLVRDLVKELRQLLSLVKGTLLKKDKEDKENLKEIEEQFAAIDDLVRELEAAAQSVMEAETSASGVIDAAIDDTAVSISVFA
ncbi:MAG: hypothetical protein LBU11_03175 [Zoogloeaceae bacterium]|jgi:hypothetical protein|nr:hypothetical protein [Zoogloeaceae bacterium]